MSDFRTYLKNEGPWAGASASRAVRHGSTIYLSGQLGLDEHGALIGGGVGPEAEAAVRTLGLSLAHLGARLEDVVSVTAYLTDWDDYDAFSKAFGAAFPGESYPARATVVVQSIAMDARVEIQAVAISDGH
jgi:enamine deaminase RidA (YjgF/YER057c/UK114 family)